MNLKNLVPALAVMFLLGSCATENSGQPAEVNLIPMPQEMKVGSGTFVLGKGNTLTIASNSPEAEKVGKFLEEKIKPATGFDVKHGKNGDVNLVLDTATDLREEGYTLSSSKKGVTITAKTPAGLFYGVQTLLQLLPAEIKSASKADPARWSVPYAEITDYPRFPWRGMLLDVSRHWFTKDEVKKYIDQMSEYKMNRFHWHLTDDQGWRFEIKSLPALHEKASMRSKRVGQWWTYEPQREDEVKDYGGYYTQDDIREVLAYAAERHVTVVPEIDVPGHSTAAIYAIPELACLNPPREINVGVWPAATDPTAICAGKETTYEYMEKIFNEVCNLFPSEYIHIGGDECNKNFWKKCPDCNARMKKCGLKDYNELQSYFIKRVSGILEAKGKKLIGWDEIIEGGLAEDATVMSWRGMEGGIEAAKAGHHVIMTPFDQCYLDLYQGEPCVEPDTYAMSRLSDSYILEPVPEGVDPELILGGQGNLWAESVPHFRHAEYMAWPRGWALAEALWSNKDRRDWNDFAGRVEKHFERADEARINHAVSVYDPFVKAYTDTLANNKVWIELHKEIENLDIYYTFDNTNPDTFSLKYEGRAIEIPKDATWIIARTYRDGKPIGKQVKLTIKEVNARAGGDRR